MRAVKIFGVVAAVAAAGMMTSLVEAQNRPLSTRGHTATQLGGSYNDEGRYEGGTWIDVHYGRPILRGRQGIFGEGDEYGQGIYAGAPLWRVGADQTTTFTTEADLLIGGQRLAAGEYTMFADLSNPTAWTLIFTTWGVKQTFREDNPQRAVGRLRLRRQQGRHADDDVGGDGRVLDGPVAGRLRRHDAAGRRDVHPLGQPVGDRPGGTGQLAAAAGLPSRLAGSSRGGVR